MTVVRFHGPVAGFSGAMGEMVFADREAKNRTVAYMKTHYDPTQAQIDHRKRFTVAAAKAKAALTDPAKREFYETIAREKDLNVYAVALTDFLVAPSFQPLDLSSYKGQVGDPIFIKALDDIGLASLEVTLTAIDGTQIEQGQAVEDGTGSGDWTFRPTVPVALGSDIFVKVVGFDHAGNRAQHSENPIVGSDE